MLYCMIITIHIILIFVLNFMYKKNNLILFLKFLFKYICERLLKKIFLIKNKVPYPNLLSKLFSEGCDSLYIIVINFFIFVSLPNIDKSIVFDDIFRII